MIDVIVGGTADNAGVKAGDRLLEINGENVESATHDQAVQKVGKVSNFKLFFFFFNFVLTFLSFFRKEIISCSAC